MANFDTIKAISGNIETILAALGWQLEDLSANPQADSKTFCRVDYQGEAFEDLFGERPSYNEAVFIIRAVVNRISPGLSRTAQQEAVHALRGAINTSTLNVGDLAASRLVSWTEHTGAAIRYDPPLSSIDYGLKIRYRET